MVRSPSANRQRKHELHVTGGVANDSPPSSPTPTPAPPPDMGGVAWVIIELVFKRAQAGPVRLAAPSTCALTRTRASAPPTSALEATEYDGTEYRLYRWRRG